MKLFRLMGAAIAALALAGCAALELGAQTPTASELVVKYGFVKAVAEIDSLQAEEINEHIEAVQAALAGDAEVSLSALGGDITDSEFYQGLDVAEKLAVSELARIITRAAILPGKGDMALLTDAEKVRLSTALGWAQEALAIEETPDA